MRPLAIVCLAALVLTSAGCGTESLILGTERGYLFTGYDVLALPGEEVELRARLQAGELLRDQPGHVVRFLRDGELYRAAEIGEEGTAIVSFTPEEPGDYLFTLELAPAGFEGEPPPPTDLLVACRKADEPMVVVDLDKTLVASGFHTVLVGDPEPMSDSVDVMKRLAEKHSVIYLTHRPELFGPKSEAWLRDQDYPTGPLLLSDIRGFLSGSGAFKTGMIKDLTSRFEKLEIGIGDKISDAQAYHDNGLRSFLVIQVPERPEPEELRELADSLGQLPDAVQVVTGWGEIEKAIFEDATYPRSAAQERLRTRADDLSGARER
jgi:hypothetical protein